MHRVFVYGTLKQGFPNHAVNHGRRVAGLFVTRECYPLYLVGDRHSPWLILAPGHGCRVRGQVFEVDDAALAGMDRLERVAADDGYCRVEIDVVAEADGAVTPVYVYGKRPAQLESNPVRSGPHAEYTPRHAARYRRRSDA